MDKLKSIKLKIKATHFNWINDNFLFYTENGVKKGASSWTDPYNKPQLVAHDKSKDPIGRVIGYEIKQVNKPVKGEPKDYVQLTVRLNDPDAINKVLDGRYNTVSVGSRSTRIICSECDQVLTEEGLCEHKKGTYNEDGEVIYWKVDQIDYTEDSFVNEPADKYTEIEEIDYGKGWTNYKDFLKKQESDSNFLEDMFMKDYKLSYSTRKDLPDAAFAFVAKQGDSVIRKFPANDPEHIKNGISKISQSKLEDSLKNKILASLKRKAKRFDIELSDELNVDETIGIDGSYSEDEVKAIVDWFTSDSKIDLIDGDEEDKEPISKQEKPLENSDNKNIANLEKNELVDLVNTLNSKIKTIEDENKVTITNKDQQIGTLNSKIVELKDQVKSLEDEVNRYLDKVAILNKNVKDQIIENIIDLKMTDNIKDTRDELVSKLSKRTVESLLDALMDLRSSVIVKDIPKIDNPTLSDDTHNSDTSLEDSKQNEVGVKDPKFKIFEKDRS